MKFIINLLFCILVVLPAVSIASETQGTINPSAKYAWSDNLGWINFAPAKGGLQITDTAVTGTAWSNNNGWINFAPDKGGVLNDGQGHLSGSAWGEQIGWIDFSGVSIDSTGKFTGTATGVVIGKLIFDCSKCDVTTDWRALYVRFQLPSNFSLSGGSGQFENVSSLDQQINDGSMIIKNNSPEKFDISSGLYSLDKQDTLPDNPIVNKGSKNLSATSSETTINTNTDINQTYKTPLHTIQNIVNQVLSFTYHIFYVIYFYIKSFFWK